MNVEKKTMYQSWDVRKSQWIHDFQ